VGLNVIALGSWRKLPALPIRLDYLKSASRAIDPLLVVRLDRISSSFVRHASRLSEAQDSGDNATRAGEQVRLHSGSSLRSEGGVWVAQMTVKILSRNSLKSGDPDWILLNDNRPSEGEIGAIRQIYRTSS
jgi:hypothetical protein